MEILHVTSSKLRLRPEQLRGADCCHLSGGRLEVNFCGLPFENATLRSVLLRQLTQYAMDFPGIVRQIR